MHRKESAEQFAEGVKRFAIGLGKKVILANNIGFLFSEISNTPQSELSVTASWLGILAYTFQIYFDFSGYSDMAIGLGKMFGFDFLENFNYPYISKSITDFLAQMAYISLHMVQRLCLYPPWRQQKRTPPPVPEHYDSLVFNRLLAWCELELHAVGRIFRSNSPYGKNLSGKSTAKTPTVFQHIYALIFIIIGWGIFAFEDTTALINNLKNMFFINDLPLINSQALLWIAQYAVTFVILIIASTPLFRKIGEKLSVKIPAVYGCVIQPIVTLGLLVISTAYLASNSFNPFLYFRF